MATKIYSDINRQIREANVARLKRKGLTSPCGPTPPKIVCISTPSTIGTRENTHSTIFAKDIPVARVAPRIREVVLNTPIAVNNNGTQIQSPTLVIHTETPIPIESIQPVAEAIRDRQSRSSSAKAKKLLSKPLSNKGVTAVPGIGEVYGKRLHARKYRKASDLLRKFWSFNKNEVQFAGWLKGVCGANSRYAKECAKSLGEYFEKFGEKN